MNDFSEVWGDEVTRKSQLWCHQTVWWNTARVSLVVESSHTHRVRSHDALSRNISVFENNAQYSLCAICGGAVLLFARGMGDDQES